MIKSLKTVVNSLISYNQVFCCSKKAEQRVHILDENLTLMSALA